MLCRPSKKVALHLLQKICFTRTINVYLCFYADVGGFYSINKTIRYVYTNGRETLIALQGVNIFPRKNRRAFRFNRVCHTFI
jgi:hypothetical protein